MPTVLIVDDEPAIPAMLCLAFGRAGYEVRTADGPVEAMELCASHKFDAVLSDIQMPGLDGHSLIRWVASQYPDMQSVLMSGFDIHCGDCSFAGRCKLLRKTVLALSRRQHSCACDRRTRRKAYRPVIIALQLEKAKKDSSSAKLLTLHNSDHRCRTQSVAESQNR